MKQDVELYDYADHKILCNYENGAVALIDEENLPLIEEWLSDGHEEAKEKLEEIGFLSPTEDPKQVYLHVTHHCNLDCTGCYSAISNRNKKEDMELETFLGVIDELTDHGFTDLVISGGEPLLRKDLPDIVVYAKEKGMHILLITNGSIPVPDEILENIDILSISLDDLEEEVNPLGRVIHKEKILAQFQKAKEAGILYNGIVTLTNENIGRLGSYYSMGMRYEFPITYSLFYSNDTKAKDFIITDARLEELAISNFEILPGLIEGLNPLEDLCCRRNCGAGSRSISVDASGELAPCHFMHDMPLGNMAKNPQTSWTELERFQKRLNDVQHGCGDCEHLFFCGRGCLARSHGEGGFERKDPYCNFYDTFYQLQKQVLFGE